MAVQDEITALRRLMESINRQSSSNSASLGKITTQAQETQQQLVTVKHVADRALQMCNDLSARVAALERK